jgi:hypothetical protein
VLLCILLAVLPAPVVEGRVGEPSGVGVEGAQVTLTQGDRTQALRTGPGGEFRFRAFAGPASVSIVLPRGWTLEGPAVASFEALPGRTLRTAFLARPRRVLRGRLLLGGGALADVDLEAGGIRTHTDAQGAFAAEGVPGGKVVVRMDWLIGSAEMPQGPAEVTTDIALVAPRLPELRLRPLPQPPAVRAVAAWIEGRPLTEAESGDIERLAALVNLNPAFRLVMVARADGLAQAARGALVFRRYLAGPFLVPRERIFFAVGEVAPRGSLALLLMRPEGE